MLLGAKLTNFKKHRKLNVEFTPGMNVIRGPNFAGKSGLLSAIAFAKYGIKAIASDKDELITTGEKSCKVELRMIIPDGTEVEITRTHKDAKVINIETGNVLATGNLPVTSWVEDTFGADVKEYLTHTYSRQMETSVLLTIGAAELQKKVEAMAKISIIDKIIKAAGKKIVFLNGKLEGLKIGEFSINELKKLVDSAKLIEKNQVIKVSKLDDKFKTLDDNVTKLRLNINKQEEENSIILMNREDLESEKDWLKDQVSTLSSTELSLSKLPKNLQSELKSAEIAENEFVQNFIIQTTEAPKRKSLEDKLKSTKTWIADHGEPNVELAKKLQPDIDEANNECENYDEGYKTAKKSIRVLQLDIDRLSKSIKEGVCPTCLRPHENFNAEPIKQNIKKLNMEIDRLWQMAENCSLRYNVYKKQLDGLMDKYPGEGTEEALGDAVIKQESYQFDLLQYHNLPSDEVIEKAGLEMSALRVKTERIKELSYTQSGLIEERERLIEVVKQSENKIDLITPLAEDLTFNVTDLINDHTKLTDSLAVVDDILVEEKQLLDRLKWDSTASSNALVVASNKEDEGKAVRLVMKLTEDLRKYLRDSRSRFLGSIWNAILARASEIAASTTQGSEDQITEIRMRDDGKFTYIEKGVEFSVKSASGCQQEIMGVSLRLALCDLFYGQGSYLMLDEASSQMNDENSASLAGTLAATGKQILYVTHRMSEQTIAQNIIFIGGDQ